MTNNKIPPIGTKIEVFSGEHFEFIPATVKRHTTITFKENPVPVFFCEDDLLYYFAEDPVLWRYPVQERLESATNALRESGMHENILSVMVNNYPIEYLENLVKLLK